MVIVDDLRSRPAADGVCEISARVRPGEREPLRLWWRIPEDLATEPLDGSPFVVAAFVWGLGRGEETRAEVPVAPRLAANLEAIAQRYGPRDAARRPPVLPPPTAGPPPAHPRTGCFFGMGVDSWFAVLTALEDEPQDPPLTDLVFSPDLLSDTWAQEVRDEHSRLTRESAARVGCRVIEVRTNLRRELSSGQNRVTLAATALALGLARVLVPSNLGWPRLGAPSRHALVDERFSTERTTVVHYGEARRISKVARIARSRPALETLHVCGRKRMQEHRNCGRCEKCLRTMMALHIAGADYAPRFDADLLPTLLGKRGTLGHREQWEELLRALGDTPQDRALAAAGRLLLAQGDLVGAAEELARLAGDPSLRDLAPRLPRAARRGSRLARRAHTALRPDRLG
jgi:hypothetical protein